MRPARSHHASLLLLFAVLATTPAEAQFPLAGEILAECGRDTFPDTRWRFAGTGEFTAYCGTPLIVQVNDDDGDGIVDGGDIADVATVHDRPGGLEARLVVIDGATGAPLITGSVPLGRRMIAAADVDRDGRVEYVALRPLTDGIILLDDDGSLLWDVALPPPGLSDCPLGIADFDQDGSPEIFACATVLDIAGGVRFRGSLGRGGVDAHSSHAVDVHPSPGLELLAGNTLYAADGSVLWQAALLPDGLTGVGDADGDGAPEIFLTGTGILHVLNPLSGAELAAPLAVPSMRSLSSPLIGDFDADGLPEIFVASQTAAVAVRFVGGRLEQIWSQPINDSSCCAGASAFDFDGDGALEILHSDHERMRVFDGRTGQVLLDRYNRGQTAVEYPVVTDLDGDGAPEIVIPSCHGIGISVLECPCQSRPRRIWNQHSYHVTNVNDDATIPAVEAAPFPLPGWNVQVRGPLESCVLPVRPTRCGTCADLLEVLGRADIDILGVRQSLRGKVQAACASLDRARRNAATNQLSALLLELTAQSGQHVSQASAEEIRTCVLAFAQSQGLRVTATGHRRGRGRP